MSLAEQLKVVSESGGEAAKVADLVVDNLDIWTSAIKNKSSAGRGSGSKRELYGIKKLRELILELAVRGLLVPQNSSDEPACQLLNKIDAEKERLVKEGKLKRQKRLPAVSDDEKPFEIPRGWEFERVGNLVSKLGSGSTPRGGKNAYVEEGIPFLRSQNVWNDGLKLDDIAYIPSDTHEKMENTKVLPGDVLLNITGASLGRSTIFPDELIEANVSQHVTIIRLLVPEMARFIHLGILSPMVQKLVWGRQVGMAIEGLSKKVLEMFEFPIPPIEEQHRIVAKVDELMVLCDQLEQQTEASLTAHETLVETLLGALINAENHTSFQQAWQRIAQHFDTLFTTEHSIDQLKQTILQLAVQGKLVPQDSGDEPACVLLEKIAAEKDRLIKEAGLKTSAKEIVENNAKFITVPPGWEWVRLGNLAKFIDYRGKTPNKVDAGVRLITAKNVRFGYIDLEPEEFISEEEYKKWMTRGLPRVGDLLFTPEAPLGNVAKVELDEKFALAQRAICFQLHRPELASYLRLFIMSSYFQFQLLENATGMTATGIKASRLKEIPIAIPPLREQYRMVGKVDELIAHCDQLKIGLNAAKSNQIKLAEVLALQGGEV